MGESACLMPNSFSHASGTAHEDREANPVPVLTGSISFGRFMSETLDWGKWSSFSRNKNLEEVEKYSTPGSVAQKKAYFEAHYKRIAAKKAAALLEQANAADFPESEENNEATKGNLPDSGISDDVSNQFHNVEMRNASVESKTNMAIDNQDGVVPSATDVSSFVQSNKSDSVERIHGLETGRIEVDLAKEVEVHAGSPLQNELPQQLGDVENQSRITELEHGKITQKENLPLMDNSAATKKKTRSASKSVVPSRSNKLPPKPATPAHPSKENNATPNSKKSTRDVEKKRSTPKSLHMSINFAPKNAGEFTPKIIKRASPIHEKSGGSKITSSSSKKSPDRSKKLPPKLATLARPSKENNATPDSKKSTRDAEKKRSTPKSLHMSINFAPKNAGEFTPKSIKRASPIHEKSRGSKINSSSSKKSPDSSNALKTSAVGSTNRALKLSSVTPQSEIRRTRTPLENTTGSRKVDRKWQSLSMDRSKSSSVCGTDTRSPTVSTPFSFRSDERAAKRKEYFLKLEEKFNAKEKTHVDLQAKSKERAEIELKKLRQSLGFKAKPMPDFYPETESPKNLKKIPLTRPRSPKLGRRSSPSTAHDAGSIPPLRTPVKNDASKHFSEKRNQAPNRSFSSSQTKNAHENSSPNIQH